MGLLFECEIPNFLIHYESFFFINWLRFFKIAFSKMLISRHGFHYHDYILFMIYFWDIVREKIDRDELLPSSFEVFQFLLLFANYLCSLWWCIIKNFQIVFSSISTVIEKSWWNWLFHLSEIQIVCFQALLASIIGKKFVDTSENRKKNLSYF